MNPTMTNKEIKTNTKEAEDELIEKFVKEMLENRTKLGYDGDSNIKEVEGSIKQRIRTDTLNEYETKMLDDLASEMDWMPEGTNVVELFKHENTLLKTLTSVSEYVKIISAEREKRRQQVFQAFDELNNKLKLLTQKQKTQAPQEQHNQQSNQAFTPIQGESKNKETYKDEVKTHFFKNFLEVQREQGVDILELMLNSVSVRV